MWLIVLACAVAVSVAEPGDLLNVTFVNELSDSDSSLFWHGSSDVAGPRAVFGPLPANGGVRELEATVGHVFTFARVGTLDPIVKHVVRDGVSRYLVTDADAASLRARRQEGDDPSRCEAAAACRAASGCAECLKLGPCGWSVVRHGCFAAHPIVTESKICEEPPAASRTAAEWLEEANALLDPEALDYGPASLRAAYRMLERSVEAAAAARDSDSLVAAAAARDELAPKLEAVFDDEDARELLAATRHAPLAALHPQMPAVARRTLAEALEYIARGEPVVVTDMFASGGGKEEEEAEESLAETYPVAHKWTLAYLNSSLAADSDQSGTDSPTLFNVASDEEGQCCQYYEPRKVAIEAGYPYPFRPRTHLYRDTFDGFIGTMRAAVRERAAAEQSGDPSPAAARTLHYLHEVVMEQDKPLVAGGAAPPGLAADLDATAKALLPVARLQPFFAGIANAKLWIGQRGVSLPLHYDSTDNLYVMAWGRKRAVLAEPGQLDALYRYPNAHPHVGTTQVNISAPDLARHPRFARAKLREVVVGPGDVFYLPGYWWHQFEQPFESTASLNMWTREMPARPGSSAQERDARVRGIALYDHLEASVVTSFGNKAGVILESLASDSPRSPAAAEPEELARANETLHLAAGQWRDWVAGLSSGPEAMPAVSDIVAEFLELGHRDAMSDSRWPGWAPGTAWDLSMLTTLPPELRARCRAAPAKATFASVCGRAP